MWRIETNCVRRAGTFALLAGVLGCGGRVGDESRPGGASSAVPPALPALPPRSGQPTSPPPRAESSQPPRSSPAPAPTMPPPQRPEMYSDEGYSAKDAAEDVLAANCGYCHGPDVVGPGIHFINDMDQLVAAGLVVPLNSAGSRIVRVMVDGSMPPPSSGLPFVTEADINTVIQYIDNPRFWPELAPPIPDGGVTETDTPPVDAGADGG